MDHAAPDRRRIFLPVTWLISPRADLVGLLGSVGVAWALFILWSTATLTAVQVVVLWVFLLHGPHLWGTISRTYADREQFRKRRKLFLGSLGWFAVAPAIVGLGLFFQMQTGRADLIQLFFLLAMIWAFHHVAKQHFGFLALYRAKHREFNKREFFFSKYYLLVSLWMPGVIFLTSNQMLAQLPGVSTYWYSGPHAIGVIQSTQAFVHAGCEVVFWGAQVAYLGMVIWKMVTGRGANLPVLILILCCVPLTWVVLMANRLSPEFFVLVPILTSYHNCQYQTLIWKYNQTKYAARDLDPAKRAAAGWAPILNKNVFVYLALGGIYTSATVGFEHYGLAALHRSDDLGVFMKSFFFGFAFHHYYVDSKIWHASEDPELRRVLGFQGPKKPQPPLETSQPEMVAPDRLSAPSVATVTSVAQIRANISGTG